MNKIMHRLGNKVSHGISVIVKDDKTCPRNFTPEKLLNDDENDDDR